MSPLNSAYGMLDHGAFGPPFVLPGAAAAHRLPGPTRAKDGRLPFALAGAAAALGSSLAC